MAGDELGPDPRESFNPWELHLFGEVIASEDVLVGVSRHVEKEVGLKWSHLRAASHLTYSTTTLAHVATLLLADKQGIDVDTARAKIDGLTDTALHAAVILVEDDKPSTYSNGFPTSADEEPITS